MSTDLLREAAAKMRERAVATDARGAAAHWFTPIFFVRDGYEREDAEHIAAMTPRFAVAVADTLAALAKVLDEGDHTVESDVLPTWLHCHLDNIAAAYLGCDCPTDTEIDAAVTAAHQANTGGNK